MDMKMGEITIKRIYINKGIGCIYNKINGGNSEIIHLQ